jgi:hypothetical protein
MSSAWGNSWSSFWGVSWGGTTTTATPTPGGVGNWYKTRRKKRSADDERKDAFDQAVKLAKAVEILERTHSPQEAARIARELDGVIQQVQDEELVLLLAIAVTIH